MPYDKKSEQLTGRASIHAGTYIDGKLQQTPAQKAAAGPEPDVQTVKMDILRDGSFNGEYYHTGESADVPEEHVETLTLSGFAARSDRAEVAQRARDEKAQELADAEYASSKKGRRSTAVRPMGTHEQGGTEPVEG